MSILIETPPTFFEADPATLARRVHSYLYQVSEKLNEALVLVDKEINDTQLTLKEQMSAASTVLAQKAKVISQNTVLHEAESLRSLIVGNAELIESTREEILRTLASSYVARSEFGTYTENAQAQFTATAESLIQEYNRSETITGLQSDAEAAKTFQRDYEGYIKTGFLFRDGYGNPVYGIAVGENLTRVTQIYDGHEEVVLLRTGFQSVFTASKLSFYQDDKEVAWLSNNQLYISQAVVLETFQIGALLATVDANGIALTWVE